MITPVYSDLPHKSVNANGATTISTVSGILGGVVLSASNGNTLNGKVTLADNTGTIQVWGAGTVAQSVIFNSDYAQPLTVTLTASTGSDYVTVMAGPV